MRRRGSSSNTPNFMIGSYQKMLATEWENNTDCRTRELCKRPTTSIFRATQQGLEDNLNLQRICPGHGKTSTIADEKADNPFLQK